MFLQRIKTLTSPSCDWGPAKYQMVYRNRTVIRENNVLLNEDELTNNTRKVILNEEELHIKETCLEDGAI